MTIEGESDCEGEVCDVDGIDDDGLDLAATILSSLVLNLFIIAFIWLISLVIIACRAFIVTGVSAV